MAENSAWAGIMRENMPMNKSTLTAITVISGACPILVQIATMMMVMMVPKQKVRNLP